MAVPFSVGADDRVQLGNLAKLMIVQSLAGEGRGVPPLPPDASPLLRSPLGAFVTLHQQGRLRGCIGNMVSDDPLWNTVARMACAAAFDDRRFPPLSPAEWPTTEVEISVLGPLEPCPDPARIELGRHGLLLAQGGRSGVFLPQVPVDQGWDLATYLAQLCGKANLPRGAWQAPDARLYWFESVVFVVKEANS